MPQADQPLEAQASRLEFVFAGGPGAMTAARDRIMDFLHEHEVGQPEDIDILVALQEALANAVLHGCKNDPSQIVRCSVEVDAETITIIIRDPGPGFNTAAVTDVSDDGTNLTQHGRGILLMRGLMDEVSYSHGGSELRLTKRHDHV